MDATPRLPADPRPDPSAIRPDRGGEGDFSGRARGSPEAGRRDVEPEGADTDVADSTATMDAYAEHKRRFVEAGGTGPRFVGLRLLEAARLQANRIWGALARSKGEDAGAAPEREVRNSLDGLAVEAGVARSKGRLRAFTRRIWPFGLPWH